MRITKPSWGPLAHGNKANLLTPGCGEQCSVYCRGPCTESGQLAFKRPELPDGSQGEVFEARVRLRVIGCVNSPWMFF